MNMSTKKMGAMGADQLAELAWETTGAMSELIESYQPKEVMKLWSRLYRKAGIRPEDTPVDILLEVFTAASVLKHRRWPEIREHLLSRKLNPWEADRFHRDSALYWVRLGDAVSALGSLRRTQRSEMHNPFLGNDDIVLWFVHGRIHQIEGDLEGAERLYRKAEERWKERAHRGMWVNKEWRRNNLFHLVVALAAQGKDSRKEFGQLLIYGEPSRKKRVVALLLMEMRERGYKLLRLFRKL